MSKWIDRTTEHSVLQTIEEVKLKVDRLMNESNEPEVIEALEQIILIANYSEVWLKSADPQIIAFKTLNNIQSKFNNISNDLDNYMQVQPSDINHLNKANDRVDSIIHDLGLLPYNLDAPEIKDYQSVLSKFYKGMDAYIKDILERDKKYVNDLDNLKEQIKQSEKLIEQQKQNKQLKAKSHDLTKLLRSSRDSSQKLKSIEELAIKMPQDKGEKVLKMLQISETIPFVILLMICKTKSTLI